MSNRKTFKQWCLENNRYDLLARWDDSLNNCQPEEVYRSSNNRYYFKCPKRLHESTLRNLAACTRKSSAVVKCNGCNSIAQFGLDNISEDFLDLYWDWKMNNESGKNPWSIPQKTTSKVWIRCQQNKAHKSYLVSVANFTINGSRCPYCSSRKVHPKDSLGQHILDAYGKNYLTKIWSVKNNSSPFIYSLNSNRKVWFKCSNSHHSDYQKSIYDARKAKFNCPKCSGHLRKTSGDFNKEVFDLVGNEYVFLGEYKNNKFKLPIIHMKCGHRYVVSPDRFLQGNRCPKCNESKGESKIRKWFEENNIAFESQKEFDDLIGLGGGNLSYDFYLPNQNLLIEYQGEFHDGSIKFQTENQLLRQQEHDSRKREFATQNNIELLEIWYWDYENIEKILLKKLIRTLGGK
ncbi:zinc-ribbon domain-containing protein [Robertmurraya siralis]|uniref:zinc-ribbon domain-containing protein n=1 Tax=Robertmurraya siralis TaxID=77777 RepID=UPI0010F766A7|nr:zinc-ribbon domain-containing protein [Robertmurraya siralis]